MHIVVMLLVAALLMAMINFIIDNPITLIFLLIIALIIWAFVKCYQKRDIIKSLFVGKKWMRAKILIPIITLTIALIGGSVYLNTDLHKQRKLAASKEKTIKTISSYLRNHEEISDAKVSLEGNKYVVQYNGFSSLKGSEMLQMCWGIASTIGDINESYKYNSTTAFDTDDDFVIRANGSDYTYLISYEGLNGSSFDGERIYLNGRMFYEEVDEPDVYRPQKNETTCQWAGCYNDREGLNEYCGYHSNHLRGVNEAVEGF